MLKIARNVAGIYFRTHFGARWMFILGEMDVHSGDLDLLDSFDFGSRVLRALG